MSLLPKNKNTREEVLNLAKESNRRSQIETSMSIAVTSKKGSLLDRINSCVATVEREFKNSKNDYKLITNEIDLEEYIFCANKTGLLVTDTETSSLDPISCTMAGISLYSGDYLKPAYCPINHVSYTSGRRLDNQLSPEILIKHLNNLNEDVKLIFHNAKFDLRVMRNQLKLDMFKYLWWDTMIASCLLNENELHDLKYQYATYCDDGNVSKYKDLFSDIPFHFIPIKTGYLYAAKDVKMTYELFKYQEPYLTADNELCQRKGLEKVALYYQDIELPVIDSLCEMEDAGCEIDVAHLEELSERLHKDLVTKEKEFRRACEPYNDDIKKYRLQNADKCKLDDPILISSPAQISVLLYDIIECESVDKKKPKSTEAPILVKLKNKYKDDKEFLTLINVLIDYRGIEKLISTYVDSIPKLINPVSGKLHTNFNQHIVRTGRLSSSDPNFQNLPKRSKVGKEVRRAFKVGKDEVMIFGDFSKQEPAVLGEESGDENLKQSFIDEKDVYSDAASRIYNVSYEDCLEYKDGKVNPDGEKKRSDVKAIILGIMYEKQPISIAEDLGITTKEAQNLYNTFFEMFPKVKTYRDELMLFAEEHGYVNMINGMRRARIPDMTLPKYEITRISEGNDFDPLDGIDDMDFDIDPDSITNRKVAQAELIVDDETYEMYYTAMNKAYGWKRKMAVIERAAEDGIKIVDNTFKIQEAIRQVVNSVIQGSAGIITKNAKVKLNAERVRQLKGRRPAFYKQLEPYISRSKWLKDNGVVLCIQVHDELINRCKLSVAKEAKKIINDIMVESAADLITVPMKVDCEVSQRWLGEKIEL